jgi:hypothetical protein
LITSLTELCKSLRRWGDYDDNFKSTSLARGLLVKFVEELLEAFKQANTQALWDWLFLSHLLSLWEDDIVKRRVELRVGDLRAKVWISISSALRSLRILSARRCRRTDRGRYIRVSVSHTASHLTIIA